MQTVTLLASFFEVIRIKALSLQKDGETALLLWLKLFFAAIREDGDGMLTLYNDVPHDGKFAVQRVTTACAAVSDAATGTIAAVVAILL